MSVVYLKTLHWLATGNFIVFLILKLAHVADWSWIYVCMPVIVETGIVSLVLALELCQPRTYQDSRYSEIFV